jgi:Ca2+/H+ antiporter
MRPSVPTSAASPLLWFGVAGAPLSWVAQFSFNYWLTEADCSLAGTRWGIALNAWVIGATVLAAAVALAAGLTAAFLFRATSGVEVESSPPLGRVRFLATVGIAITPLFLAIILMNGVGATILPDCHQS